MTLKEDNIIKKLTERFVQSYPTFFQEKLNSVQFNSTLLSNTKLHAQNDKSLKVL
jgi:hypothetical protein